MTNPNFRIGMTAIEVVVEIVKINPKISRLFFKVYTSSKNLEEEPVIQIRTSIARMVYHNPPELEEVIGLGREEVTFEHLNSIVNTLPDGRALGVISKVGLSGTDDVFHIPMMDFRCEVLSGNLAKIEEFLRLFGQKGAILFSGKSYHYYGIELLSQEEWLVFLGRCLLFCDPKDPRYVYTDIRYVGHRLIDGYTNLRISKETRRVPHYQW